MSQLITASIDVMKIKADLCIKGKKGTYCNLVIWINDEPDKYGNDISIEQKTEKGSPKIFLGNGKTFKKESPANKEGVPQKGGNDLNEFEGREEGWPFK